MKKIVFLSAGILLLAAILISGGFNFSASGQKIGDDSKPTVTIHLKAVIHKYGIRLKLSDSNGNIATDYLITEVPAGGTIIWKLGSLSKIDTIKRIYSTEENRVIFQKEPSSEDENVFKLVVPEGIASGTMEKYKIIFIYRDGNEVTIDPYIRIEP